MFKLKIIDKPKMFKLKCDFEFPQIPLDNLQEKEVNPTINKQEIVADKEYSALSKVTVNAVTNDIDDNIQANNIKKDVSILGVTGNVVELKGETKIVLPTKENQTILPSEGKNGLTSVFVEKIPDEYIIPSGEININSNGTYDVTDKASANVNIPEKVLGTKTITTNGTYKATDDNVDGYSEVVVSTSGVDINDYYDLTKKSSGTAYKYIKQIPMLDTSDYTAMSGMFNGYSSLTTIPQLDTSKVTNMNGMFSSCESLKEIPLLNTSKVTNMNAMFNSCKGLSKIPSLDTSQVTDIETAFQNCKSLVTIPKLNFARIQKISMSTFLNCDSLENVGGFADLGKLFVYDANNYHHTVCFSYSAKLTHESLMNIINYLYDISSKKTQQLELGSTNLAKLTAEEIQIATDKGFSVS